MEVVIKKLEEGYARLVQLTKDVEAKDALLNKKADFYISKDEELKVRIADLEKREAVVKQYDGIDAGRLALNKMSLDMAAERAAFDAMVKDVEAQKLDVEKRQKELVELTEIYKSHNANIVKEKAELAEERKTMKDSILEQISKGLK